MRIRMTASLSLCLIYGTLLAQPPAEKPPELEALGQHVGDWKSEVTSRKAVWTPEEQKLKATNHREFILDGWFLMDNELNHDVAHPEKVGKSLSLLTYDPSEKQYVTWYFQSSGLMDRWTGKWNPETKTFTWTVDDPPENTTATVTETFADADTLKGHLTYTDDSGRSMFDMVWTRTRDEGQFASLTRQLWNKIEKPIKPIPSAVKQLQPLVGEWRSEYIQQPSAASPQGNRRVAAMSGAWILDGRFFRGHSTLADYETIWIIGYDTDKQIYRYVRFDNRGDVEEHTGLWKDDTRTFEWNLVNGDPRIKKNTVMRLIGNNTIQSHIVSEDTNGHVLLDLTIRSTRKK